MHLKEVFEAVCSFVISLLFVIRQSRKVLHGPGFFSHEHLIGIATSQMGQSNLDAIIWNVAKKQTFDPFRNGQAKSMKFLASKILLLVKLGRVVVYDPFKIIRPKAFWTVGDIYLAS